MQAVKTWHRKCSHNHKECNKTLSKMETIDVNNAPLPSRCVEFLRDPGSDHLLYRLRETRGLQGKYIILSHRWNATVTKASSTTWENYERRVDGLPGSTCVEEKSGSGWTLGQELNDLFIDIGTLAVSLDIKYVWIDSICIVQQDTTDWKNEAAMMAAYYQNAWLTVAATKTVTEGRGFLHQTTMDPSSIPRVSRLPYRNKEGRQEGHFYLQGLPGSTLRQEYEDNIINSDLLNRGWVFQEWILSPRILCFSSLTPFLVCAELPPVPIAGNVMTNHEIDSTQARPDFAGVKDPFAHGDNDLLEQGYKYRLGLDLTVARAAVFDTWRKLIMIYSGLELTRFENDRLVALAGVAKEIGSALSAKPVDRPGEAENTIQAKYSNTYACGMWLGDIVRELQWERSDGLKRPPCRARGFPTWSWLSLGSPTLDETGKPTLGGAKVQWPGFEVYSDHIQSFTDIFRNAKRTRLPDPVWCISLESARVIPIGTESDGWPTILSPNDEWEILEPFDGINVYGNENRFVALCFQHARFIKVQLGPRFDSQRHSSIAAKCTSHESDVQRDHWRVVTMPVPRGGETKSQEIIRGWASLEHPDYQRPERDPKEDCVLALRIAHLPEVRSMGGRYISLSDTAAIVLYVRKSRRDTGDRAFFERLGVGRLFGSEIENEFAAAEEGEIWLI